MVCYVVPVVAAVVHYFMRKNVPSMKGSAHHSWLSLLFAGGAIFGFIDHLWNGELFLIGENLLMDLALGVTITAAIMAVWKILVVYDGSSKRSAERLPA